MTSYSSSNKSLEGDWLSHDNHDQRKPEKEEVKGEATKFIMRGMGKDRAEHDNGKDNCSVTS